MMTTVEHQSMSKTEMENQRRDRRKGSYHLVSSKNRLPTEPEEEAEDTLFQYLTSTSNRNLRQTESFLLLQGTKAELLREMASSGGDTTSAAFHDMLARVTKIYDPSNFDARKLPCRPSKCSKRPQSPQMEGMWIDLSKSKFSDLVGINDNRDCMYTLGRMSFDMFRPTHLVCCIQGTFNPVHFVNGDDAKAVERVPRSLEAEMKDGSNVLRTYDIVTAFTIEAHQKSFGRDSPNRIVDKPVKDVMTTFGYILPNPEKPNRIAIWFTGGTIEVNDDPERWHAVFDDPQLPKRTLKEQARTFFAKVAMGAVLPQEMEEDGTMTYDLTRPIGGHDTAYVDILYIDETLRIARASSGTVYAFARVPYFPDE